MFLNGNMVAQIVRHVGTMSLAHPGSGLTLQAFRNDYGVEVPGSGMTIPTKWQSALFQAGQCGGG